MADVRTRTLNIPYDPRYEPLNAESAKVYNECVDVTDMWLYAHGCKYFPAKHMSSWINSHLSKSQKLHSHSIQFARHTYIKSWKSYQALRKNGDMRANPPMRKRKHLTTTWWKSAITFCGHTLRLTNGRGNAPLEIQLPRTFDMSESARIATIELVYKHGQYALHFTYKYNDVELVACEGVVGIDIGEIHPMVAHDGRDTVIFNGRYIRSLYRLRNKVIAGFGSKIDRCQKYSRRWWHLVRRKWKRLNRIDNQIRDGLHKHTRSLVDWCEARNIGTVVVGDLTGIRSNIAYGRRANQKLHQWPFGKLTMMIGYKCKSAGISVEVVSERYTSQTCPSCGTRHKPRNRNYKCQCGYVYHRDGVGAINIRQKYLGDFGRPVVVPMHAPIGKRLVTRCCPA